MYEMKGGSSTVFYRKSASALVSPDGQMFFCPKSLVFRLLGQLLFDPEGLGRLRWTILEVKIYTSLL